MSSLQHTPGPWYITATGTTVRHGVAGDPDGWVCRTDEDHRGYRPPVARAAANARLIAAAPDLLAALKLAERAMSAAATYFHDEFGNPNKPLASTRAAIAKASGGAA